MTRHHRTTPPPRPAAGRRLRGRGTARFEPAIGLAFSGAIEAPDGGPELSALLVLDPMTGPSLAEPEGALVVVDAAYEDALRGRVTSLALSGDLIRVTLGRLAGPLAARLGRRHAVLTLTGPFGADPARLLLIATGSVVAPALVEIAPLALEFAPPVPAAGPSVLRTAI